ncbi:MAG: DUF4923 family protein [Prevotella sp.]|nr:DUF4923 family protein [Prevotella sp.]
MRKLFTLIACVMLSAGVANAQLGDILGKVASAASSATSGNSTLNTLTNIISSKLVPTSQQILGTWTYQEPAVMFTSDNALKSAASSVATKSIETKLQSYLNKVGITKGNLSITFKEDKTFIVNKKGKVIKTGTYAINNSEITLTFKGRKTPSKVTPQLDNGTLVIVMDATKLKTFMQNIGSNVSQLSTIVSLMKSMDGMKLGIRLSK